MPRARWVKPDFFHDKKIASLSPESALVFEAIWCWADDGGVCKVDPDWLKNQVFFRWEIFTLPVISKALRDLHNLKMVLVYRIGDDYYGSIRHWDRHQNVHKPSKFRYPRPDEQLTFISAELPPESPGTPPGTVPGPPPSRHLDTKTPRQLEVEEGDPGTPPALMHKSPVYATANDDTRTAQNVGIDADRRRATSTAEAALAARLETDPDRLALTAICQDAPAPHQWVAEAAASLDGMHGPPLSPRQLGEALREYVGNGNLRTPNFRHFRGYLRTASNPQSDRMTETATKAPGSTNGQPVRQEGATGVKSGTSGEAGALLARIKGLRQTSNPQAGGTVEFIPRSEVEAMGADVWSAYQSVGGADAILKGDPSKWGFLVRDFAAALDYARKNPTPGGSDG